jgi:hypothetical protein
MRGKIFTPDEANRMLPLVSRIADDIVQTYANVNRALQAFEAAKARAQADPTLEIEVRRRDEEVAGLLDRFQALIVEIEALGATVKDYESGGIDFYGDVDGEIVYLCWRRGDDRVSHWHRLEDGYSKRQPLPVPTIVA